MSDFFTNESSFLTSAKRGYPADSPENSPRRRALLPRRHATAGRDRRTGRRSVAKAQSQRGDRGSVVVRLRSRPPSGRRSRRRGCSAAKPECSPEATALPGGGTVRGHTPSSRPNDTASVPSDRSGGPELLRAAWPPRAAEGNAGDSGRIVRDGIPTCGLTGVINNSSV